MPSTERPYHHGDLRRALLDAAVASIAESGPAALSLREVARRAEVSHAAPTHHFSDKAGVLTAVAVEGYEMLADALNQVQQETGEFLEVGVAYVQFAVDHRAHFEVMNRPDLYHFNRDDVTAARTRARAALYSGLATTGDRSGDANVEMVGVAAWSLVHGFASLWLQGSLPPALGEDPGVAARSVAAVLFRTG